MSNFFKDSKILALRWCKKLCRLPLGLAETTIGQPACYGQWARLFVMLMLPLLPNINNSFKLLQFNIPLGRYNSKIESYFNNNEKWLHCLLFVAAGFAPLLKAWSQCCIRVQCRVLVFNQLSLSGRRLLMSFHINFVVTFFFFFLYYTWHGFVCTRKNVCIQNIWDRVHLSPPESIQVQVQAHVHSQLQSESESEYTTLPGVFNHIHYINIWSQSSCFSHWF